MTYLRGVKPALSRDRDPLTKTPPAPRNFSTFAAAEWKSVLPQLIARRIVTKADLAGVRNYCVAVGMADQITALMQEMPVPDLKLGGLQIRYMQTARQLAAEYGLTPTSRARVGVGETEDDDDNPLALT